MGPLHSPKEYLFNLYTTSSGEAKRMWKKHIKEQWNHQCAYCGSGENLTIDHIVPQSKGGMDFTKNVVCCCHSCNQDKGYEHWKLWYVAAVASEFGLDMGEIAQKNYEKLKKRQEEGKIKGNGDNR